MTARRDLATSVESAERDLDSLHMPLSRLIGESVRRHAIDGKITHEARRAIMAEVSTILSRAYPRRRGERSAVQVVIERRAREAAAKPIAAEVARIRKVAPVDLVRAMERGRAN